MQLRGTGVALITPFNSDKSIDFDSLKKVIDQCIDGGVNYLVSLGTTGETVVLTKKEKQEILSFTKEYVNERVPLIAGFGGNNTNAVVESIKNYDLTGYSAILSASPSYNKPTQEGIYLHYKAVAENSPLPIVLYNVPGRTSSNIEAATTIRLANEFENIIGIKEASNDMLQCMEIVRNTPESFQLVSGDDIHALPMFSFGSVGVISVIAQAIPMPFTSMVNNAIEGEFETATNLQFEFLTLIQLIFAENNPAGIKAALHHQGICANELRLPLTPASESLYQQITAEL